MKLALVQFNPTVGDLAANGAAMLRWAEAACAGGVGGKGGAGGADLCVFPELSLCGYPPKDLLLSEGFVAACEAEAQRVGQASPPGMTVVFGTPLKVVDAADGGGVGEGAGVTNSLVAYRDGKLLARYDKRLLPTYDVFDEDRYFQPGKRAVVIDVAVRGGSPVKVGLSICEDLWRGEDVGFSHRYAESPDPVMELIQAGATLIVNPSASPFVLGKGVRHRELLRRHARANAVHVAAVNQVGGNDDLVFDGHSAVFDPSGRLVASGPGFQEAIVACDLSPASEGEGVADPLLTTSDEELAFRALVLGVRDYCRKTGFRTALLGLSGGIDSALTAVIGAAALGPANVLGVSLPSGYSSTGSIEDALALGRRLGVRCVSVPIERAFRVLLEELGPHFEGRGEDVTEENLQSRVRGTMLMALSNKLGSILLTTGNKSELAVGYCTLYGDMNGGLAVLSDVTKQLVYRISKWCNESWEGLGTAGLKGPPIPEPSILKAPSAELRPGQTDQDSLPPYEVLDEILRRSVEERQSPDRIVRETGIEAALVARIVRLIDLSEYKRKQAATGIKITGVAFGSGRRFPIAQRYRPELGLGS